MSEKLLIFITGVYIYQNIPWGMATGEKIKRKGTKQGK